MGPLQSSVNEIAALNGRTYFNYGRDIPSWTELVTLVVRQAHQAPVTDSGCSKQTILHLQSTLSKTFTT